MIANSNLLPLTFRGLTVVICHKAMESDMVVCRNGTVGPDTYRMAALFLVKCMRNWNK